MKQWLIILIICTSNFACIKKSNLSDKPSLNFIESSSKEINLVDSNNSEFLIKFGYKVSVTNNKGGRQIIKAVNFYDVTGKGCDVLNLEPPPLSGNVKPVDGEVGNIIFLINAQEKFGNKIINADTIKWGVVLTDYLDRLSDTAYTSPIYFYR